MKNYFKTVYNKCHNLLTNYKGKSLNPIKPVYNKCHDFLATHKGLALFLSHGGLHLVMLILLLAILILMIDKLNRLDNADTEIINFEIRSGKPVWCQSSDGYELQNFIADFEFIRGKDDNIYSFTRFNVLPVYRPRIHRDSLLKDKKLLDSICREPFEASIAIRTKTRLYYPSVMFLDSAVLFQKNVDKEIIYNPYRNDNDYRLFDGSGRIDKVQLHKSKDYKDNDFTWIEYMCDRKRTLDSDFIRVSDTFFYFKNCEPLESPYFNVFIQFSLRDEYIKVNTDTSYTSFGANYIKLSFPTGLLGEREKHYISQLHPISFKTIQPTPSKIGLDYIVYDDVETINEILHSGIYVAAEDVDGARKVSKLSFIYSVLLGTLIAFMLDILIHLILKWRKLSTTVSKTTESKDKKIKRAVWY